jgi:hypothetical protein
MALDFYSSLSTAAGFWLLPLLLLLLLLLGLLLNLLQLRIHLLL